MVVFLPRGGQRSAMQGGRRTRRGGCSGGLAWAGDKLTGVVDWEGDMLRAARRIRRITFSPGHRSSRWLRHEGPIGMFFGWTAVVQPTVLV